MLERGDSVFVLPHSQFRGLFVGLGRRLREVHGCKVHFYVTTRQEQEFYAARARGAFDVLELMPSLYADVSQPVENVQAVYEAAVAWEQKLGVALNTIVMTDRHFGRGFALGGHNHPRSAASRAEYPHILRSIVRVAEFWQSEMDQHQPRLVLNCGKIAAVLARARGTSFRMIVGSRYRNLRYWAHSEFGDLPELEPIYRSSDSGERATIVSPYDAHLENRSHAIEGATLVRTVRKMTYVTARQIYWKLRNYDKAKGYFLREDLRYLWRIYLDMKKLKNMNIVSYDSLRNKRFVYYPLHVEPETALQTFSPEYFFQLSCIASVARDLPPDVVLVVKETVAAVGRRPRDFYAQIADFKNVVLLDPVELGLRAAVASSATVTITGTGGFEAAVSGNPVITFGRHNLYNILPHVQVIKSEEELRPALLRALSKDFDRNKAQRDGDRFLRSVEDTSFDLGDFRISSPDSVTAEAVVMACESLIRGLGGESVCRDPDTVPDESAAYAARASSGAI